MPKLFEVPRNTRIRLSDDTELNFHHIDGMYSFCVDDNGDIYHIAAFEDVEIVNKEKDK